MNPNILSVAQVNGYVKNLLENDYIVKRLWVQGEISNVKKHTSGHTYFTLKDALASISCAYFRSYQTNAAGVLRDGMKVVIQGSITLFEKTGQYQLLVKDVIEDGVGLLYQRFEALKRRLEEEGLFDERHKKALPLLPRAIGIVTSETGAVIQDIQNVARRRNPSMQLVLYPALVQGEGAAEQIVKGIRTLDRMESVDVIIIGRGGGSMEDLWAFNEEAVARAVFEAQTPIISAVGHETDFTIADFVSDMRAPTPSAAAELAVPSLEQLSQSLDNMKRRLERVLFNHIDGYRHRLALCGTRLGHFHPGSRIQQSYLLLGELDARLNRNMRERISSYKSRLELYGERLKTLSPRHKLESGYAYISDRDKLHIRSVEQLALGQRLFLQMKDGLVEVDVVNIVKED